MALEFIEIFHPELNTTSTVSDKAFEKVWADKGWVRAEDEEQEETVEVVEEEEIEEEYVYSDAFDVPEDDEDEDES